MSARPPRCEEVRPQRDITVSHHGFLCMRIIVPLCANRDMGCVGRQADRDDVAGQEHVQKACGRCLPCRSRCDMSNVGSFEILRVDALCGCAALKPCEASERISALENESMELKAALAHKARVSC